MKKNIISNKNSKVENVFDFFSEFARQNKNENKVSMILIQTNTN